MRRHPVSHNRIVPALGLLIALALSPPCHAAESASVLKDGAKLRSSPGEKGEVLWELSRGYPLVVIGRKDTWAQVRDFEGDKGWVPASLLAKKKTVIVRSDKASLRVGPGQDYEVVAAVRYGVVLEPQEQERDWLRVRHRDGTSGWILAELVWPR
ncbi:MAG: SH3 domain-containing protein [Thermodesulfobacteriota bacterium]